MKRRDALLFVALLLLAGAGGVVASSRPDGLEAVAERLGFAQHEAVHHAAPMPDYTVTGLPPRAGAVTTGLVGAALTGLLAFGAGRLLRRS